VRLVHDRALGRAGGVGGGDVAQASFWCGLRPTMPDGTPIVGATPIRSPLLATGHGTLGWTMAAGTGRVDCRLLSGREPEIDAAAFTMARYARAHGPSRRAAATERV
jgi:D-amino-acid dehydrogenase